MTERSRLQALTVQQAAITHKLSEVGNLVAASLDRRTVLQEVTDSATSLTEAEFGAFVSNMLDPNASELDTVYAVSGVPKEAIEKFVAPRATAIFGPMFHGQGIVRLDDVTQDLRYVLDSPDLRRAGWAAPGSQLPRRAGQSGVG